MSGKDKGHGSTQQEPRKPKPDFYVNDGVARYDLRRSSSPCVILHSHNGTFRTINSLVSVRNELQAYLTMDTSDHISSLKLQILIQQEDKSGKLATYNAMIRLGAHAVGNMSLVVLADTMLDLVGLSQYKREGDIFYGLQVSDISSDLISAERLFCDSPDAQHFRVVADLFRNITELHLMIHGREQTQKDFEALEAQFVSEREEDKIMAWHKNHKGMVMAQLGMFLEKSKRPNPRLFTATNSFHTWPEYMTVMAFSLVQEQEAKDALVEELQANTLDLCVATLPKSADRRYLGFLFLNPGKSVRLSSGNRLKINFDPEIDLREEDWSAVIVDPVSWAPPYSVSLLITRPFDKDEEGHGSWREGTPFQTADFNEMRDDRQARRILAKAPRAKVALRVVTFDVVHEHCLTAIQMIDMAGTFTLKRWFLASRMDEFPTVDFYASVRDKFGDKIEEELLDLDGGLHQAALGLKALRNGKQFCSGSAGTGKTHYLKQIAKPFLMDDTQAHQGIMCSITNEGVDELAVGMQALAEEVAPKGKPAPMIIRFHSLSTEQHIGLLDAKKARGKPAGARPSLVDDGLDVDILQECVFLNELFEHILRVSTHTEPLINDPRLKELQLSLGIRMLQIAGMQGFECPYSEPQKFGKVREMYRQFKENENMQPKDMQDFREAMKELRDYTLSPRKTNVQVTIIVCTFPNIATPALYHNATKVEFFLLDDVPRITEPELWPIFAHYPGTPCHVLVGDPRQLQPQLESRRNNNCFAQQLEVSLFSRFYNGGHLYSFFDQQHRAVQPIGDFVSAVFYNKMLTNAESCSLDHPSRDIARRISTFNELLYGTRSSIIFLDNSDGVAKQDDGAKSTYNISNCAVGINLAVSLVENKFDASAITILTPYTAQRRYYQSALLRADALQPSLGLHDVKIALVDGYQGVENHIVILDWTIVDNLGFLKNSGRLCAAHSRARDALYVIGNKNEVETNKQSDLRIFNKLLGREGLATVRRRLEGQQDSPYILG